uniref:RBR-type E3 ubiquitin transferase n=1 Tax=Callorhinchus milii TaxID=7868 RepID=A0A4W3J0F2_CALMI
MTNYFLDSGDEKNEPLEYSISFLPPLVLNFELLPDYPSTSAPQYTLSCKWLSQSQLSILCSRLDNLWEENHRNVVLFSWMQFLKEETLPFLFIKSPLEIQINNKGRVDSILSINKKKEQDEIQDLKEFPLDQRAVQDVESWAGVLREILDFDQNQQQKTFNRKMFMCNICFCEKLGIDSMYFKECKHVHCKACLKEYFEIQIRDGNVQCLNCPEPKCASVAIPAQVKELVKDELFARYDRLLLQSSLDLMADVMYCPRTSCQSPVMLELGSTMGVCPGCRYAFCARCKMTYHAVSPCKLKAEKLAELQDEYLQVDEAGRKLLEQRYGRRVIEKAMEELHSQEWLEKNSKPCPRCCTAIQKENGCNKMMCTGCKGYFCWLCLTSLSRANPYGHYSDPLSPCFNELFQRIEFEEEDDFLSDEDDEID